MIQVVTAKLATLSAALCKRCELLRAAINTVDASVLRKIIFVNTKNVFSKVEIFAKKFSIQLQQNFSATTFQKITIKNCVELCKKCAQNIQQILSKKAIQNSLKSAFKKNHLSEEHFGSFNFGFPDAKCIFPSCGKCTSNWWQSCCR